MITPYEQLTAGQLAASDQQLAEARHRARNGAVIVATVYADPGDRCGHLECHQRAVYRTRVMYGTPDQFGYLTCGTHDSDLIAAIAPGLDQAGAEWVPPREAR